MKLELTNDWKVYFLKYGVKITTWRFLGFKMSSHDGNILFNFFFFFFFFFSKSRIKDLINCKFIIIFFSLIKLYIIAILLCNKYDDKVVMFSHVTTYRKTYSKVCVCMYIYIYIYIYNTQIDFPGWKTFLVELWKLYLKYNIIPPPPLRGGGRTGCRCFLLKYILQKPLSKLSRNYTFQLCPLSLSNQLVKFGKYAFKTSLLFLLCLFVKQNLYIKLFYLYIYIYIYITHTHTHTLIYKDVCIYLHEFESLKSSAVPIIRKIRSLFQVKHLSNYLRSWLLFFIIEFNENKCNNSKLKPLNCKQFLDLLN